MCEPCAGIGKFGKSNKALWVLLMILTFGIFTATILNVVRTYVQCMLHWRKSSTYQISIRYVFLSGINCVYIVITEKLIDDNVLYLLPLEGFF